MAAVDDVDVRGDARALCALPLGRRLDDAYAPEAERVGNLDELQVRARANVEDLKARRLRDDEPSRAAGPGPAAMGL